MSDWLQRAKVVDEVPPGQPGAGSDWLSRAKPAKEQPGVLETAVSHGVHGASMGFSDETMGVANALGVTPETLATAPETMGLSLVPGAVKKLFGGKLIEDYRAGRDARRAQLAAQKAANPATAAISEFIGGAAPMLIPGGAAVKGVGGAVKVGAGLGAAAGLGNSTADLTKGDLGNAAADTAVGAGFGAGAGVVGHKAGELVGRAAEYLRGIARNRAISAVGPTAGQVRQALSKDEAEALADWLLNKKMVRAGDTHNDVAGRLGPELKAAGQRLNDSLAAADTTGVTSDVSDLAGTFRLLASDVDRQGPGMARVANKFRAAANEVDLNPNSVLKPSEAVDWKRGYQEPVNWAKANPSAAQQGDIELAGAAKEFAADSVSKADTLQPGIRAAYDAANKDLHLGLTAESMTEGAAAREAARNILSPSDKAALALAASHGKGVTGTAMALANKFVRGRAASTLAVTAKTASDKLAQMATTAPERLGRFGPILANALRSPGGQQAFAAHTFTLAQTDPEFSALMQRLGNEKP